jgi:feruloyl esterase
MRAGPLLATILLAAAGCARPVSTVTSAAAPAEGCEVLAALRLPDVRITSAAPVAAQPAFVPAAGERPIAVTKPFCRVQGIIETEIGFELWLPEPGDWNGKMLGAGAGGDAGAFNFRDLPRGVARGYASATTDTGHKAADTAWMLGDPARLKNFELLAHHRLAEVSKAVIAARYGQAPRYSYFIGCSGGGRQGLKEMQRFPGDYDGIIAGAPGPDTPAMTARRMWEILARDAHPGLMSREDWRLVAEEGVRTCDAADGVTDGVAEDPRQCRFDPAALACGPGRAGRCLSPQQVAFARSLYAPLHDERGVKIDDGLLPGVVVDSGRSRLAPATFGQAIRRRADWDGRDFSLAADLPAINRVMPELRADETDLTPFKRRGGKAILYQGWMDPAVAGLMTLGYYEAVTKRMGGEAATRDFIRLYMAPGVFHCAGGPGPDQFGGSGGDAPVVDPQHDLLSALEAWVEQGKPPERIVASKVEAGRVVRTRPLCPAPEVARYKGSGSTDDAANFTCVRPGA